MKKNIKSFIKYSIQQYHSLKPVKNKTEEYKDTELFFVTGYDKSGTTWIMKTINESENFSCIGSCQYFDFFDNATPVSNILSSIRKNPEKESILNISSNFFRESFINQYVSKIRGYSQPNSIYFGDKSTAQDPELINYYFPNSKIIILIRDMRDIIVSFAFHFDRGYKNKHNNWTPEKSKFNEDGTIKDDFIKRETTKLKSYLNQLLYLESNTLNLIKFVKYEDLNSDKGFDFFIDILNFIDTKSVLNRSHALTAWKNNSFEKLSKGRKPGEKDESSFFRNGLAGDYVNHLTSDQISFIENELSEPLSKFGYI